MNQEAINAPTYLRLRQRIREDIVAGVWRLGSHVTLAELGAHYQVSNIPVREALLQLQGEGIIEMRMHRGAVIPTIDERYIDHIYQIRGALQAMLARLACERATDEDVQALKALEQAHVAGAAKGDVAACVAANREFHHRLDSIADNPQAIEVLRSRSSLVDAFRRLHGYGSGRLDQVMAQHRRILQAVVKRDPERAARETLAHTESARKDLLELLRSTHQSGGTVPAPAVPSRAVATPAAISSRIS